MVIDFEILFKNDEMVCTVFFKFLFIFVGSDFVMVSSIESE